MRTATATKEKRTRKRAPIKPQPQKRMKPVVEKPAYERYETSDPTWKRWGIDRLSSSSVTLFISDRAQWYLKYIKKIKTDGPARWRGNAVENALFGACLNGLGVEECVGLGLRMFDEEAKIAGVSLGQEEIIKERELIRPMVEAGFVELVPISCTEDLSYQGVVKMDLGLGVPVLGYIDLESSVKVRDLKTTNRMPSDESMVKHSYWRQAALYSYDRKKPVSLCYIGKPTKNGSHQGWKEFELSPSRVDGLVQEFVVHAESLKKTLALCKSPEELAELISPNFDNYGWDEPLLIKGARDVWKITA